jgi:hypothetical protein
MGVTVLVPAGAIAFAAFARLSIAKRVQPTLRCPHYVAHLLVGTDGSASHHPVLAKQSKGTK